MDLKLFLEIRNNHANWHHWHKELTIFEVILDYGEYQIDKPLPAHPEVPGQIFNLKEWAEACKIGEYNTIENERFMFVRIK